MAAVVAWDHRPSAEELLEARLDRGWKPRTTPTVDGDLILGFAACLARPDEIRGASASRSPT